jgi:hypothetical protein
MKQFLNRVLSITVAFAPMVASCAVDRSPITHWIEGSGDDVDSTETKDGESTGVNITPDAETLPNRDGLTSETSENTPKDAAINASDAAESAHTTDRKTDADNKRAGDETTAPVRRPKTIAGVPYNDWNYYEVEDAICRDGSAAGYYLRQGSSKNLLIFLNGGGVCYDDTFCASNPANVDESMTGESVFDVTIDSFAQAIIPARQVPPDAGILKLDRRNPVADWTMVFVPYCTGDVYGGTHRDSPVITSTIQPPQQFVGYANIGLFLRSFGPDYLNSKKVLLAGSGAGGLGALLNIDRTQKYFTNSQIIAISDSGVPFSDQYQPPCLQKMWRQLWSLDAIIPKECAACFGADGGGLAEISKYYFNKLNGRAFGGVISSTQDEIMKLFYSAGLNNCSANTAIEVQAALRGMGSYPPDLYPRGLQDYIENVVGPDKAGSYIIAGTTHDHLFRDRFYDVNDADMSLAEWVADIINGKATHIGTLP